MVSGMKQWMIDLIAKRNPIFGAHLERIGLLRIIPAALAMYLLIPVYIFQHLIVMVLLYNGIVCPLVGVKRVRLRNYIIIDRHLIPGLSLTGRFHCIYCGYANGICVATGVLLTQVSLASEESAGGRVGVAAIPFFLASALSTLCQSLEALVYNYAIAPPLGLNTVTVDEADQRMREQGFADEFLLFGQMGGTLLRVDQRFAWIMAHALEQVESQWCPIKHLDHGPEAVFPEHHKFFVERCELCELKRVLLCEGSLSPRKPNR